MGGQVSYEDMLAAVHGGLVAFPDAAEAGYEHED